MHAFDVLGDPVRRRVLELLAERWTHEQILGSYPQLIQEDIWAVLSYAADTIKQEKVYPVPV